MTAYKAFGLSLFALLLVYLGSQAVEMSSSAERALVKAIAVPSVIALFLGYISICSLIANETTDWGLGNHASVKGLDHLKNKHEATIRADDRYQNLLITLPILLVVIALAIGTDAWWTPFILWLVPIFRIAGRVPTKMDITSEEITEMNSSKSAQQEMGELNKRKKQAGKISRAYEGLEIEDGWKELNAFQAAQKSVDLFELFASPDGQLRCEKNVVYWNKHNNRFAAVFYSGDKKFSLRDARKITNDFDDFTVFIIALNGITKGANDYLIGCLDVAVWGCKEMTDLVKDAPANVMFASDL